MKKIFFKTVVLLILCNSLIGTLSAQTSMVNVQGRNTISLNGKWQAIINPFDAGSNDRRAIWKDKKPAEKTDFLEYSFDNNILLDVPGDFNSQLPELKYYESTVWYKKSFKYYPINKRVFIHFGAVNYIADVFVNSEKVGSHEGGFTSFQFEITKLLKEGENSVILRVNNQRLKDGVPCLGYDWFNYGGITRDVNLIEIPQSYIDDYFIQLAKGTKDYVRGSVKINGTNRKQTILVKIPELKLSYKTISDSAGNATVDFKIRPKLWSPSDPKLYDVQIIGETDSVRDQIGFRTIEVKGTEILLNGKPVFLKGVNIHEENPQRGNRAYSESDAAMLLKWAQELGCNFVRLAHYPHNEYMVRLAEKMGLMVWSEIPVYQGIDFANPLLQTKMELVLKEMVSRDKNRCGIIIWSISNETQPNKTRNESLSGLATLCRSLDDTRLVSSAINIIKYEKDLATVDDSLVNDFDLIAVNQYFGWYRKWPAEPGKVVWKSNFTKPLIFSEFGGEALFGNHDTLMTASTWSEEYQEKIYIDQTKMFKSIPFLRGVCPWILADFRSPVRMNPLYQQGWNRKGLLSDKGFKKKAWFVMKNFYDSIQ